MLNPVTCFCGLLRLCIKGVSFEQPGENYMRKIHLQISVPAAALTVLGFPVHAQLPCPSAGAIGSGDQSFGGNVGSNELADACGTVGVGYYSLQNDTASLNSAMGTNAMFNTTSGANNSSFGADSMYSNTTGANNTAVGYQALFFNTTGKGNAAQGVNALYGNTTGIRNLGIGSNALYTNTTGSYNIGLGFDAGYNVTTGSNNIEIGAEGAASDNNTIQIGVQGTQTNTKIAGIYGTPVSGSAVYITASGQLGVQASSERYKTDIEPMAADTENLGKLRPVTFRYKTDPKAARQYGLIAEEVEKVYPELVIRDDKGQVQGVHYEELAPMLLGVVQRQQSELESLRARNNYQATAIAVMQRQISELVTVQRRKLDATLEHPHASDERLAER
jgi:hypothetical protein